MPRGLAVALLATALTASACSQGGLVASGPPQPDARVSAAPSAAPRQARDGREPEPPRVSARSAILIDLATGQVLFARHPDLRRPIASLTKIMTAILVLDADPALRGRAKVSRRAARQPAIEVGLKAGERLSVRDLMYGLLLWSGNDTAVALAEHVSGSVPRFVRLMNARGREMELRDTHFASPSGLDDRGLSTARDIAVLARVAMGYEEFASLVGTRRHRIGGFKGHLHRLRNLNELLGSFSGAIGVKTGYTHAAGECLVGAARRGTTSILSVVLGEPITPNWRSAYRDTRALLRFGFASPAESANRR